MKKTKFKTVVAIVLVLTSMVGLALACPGRDDHKRRGGHEFGPERPGRFGMRMGRHGGPALGMRGMLGKLDLTDEQKESVKQITKTTKVQRKTTAESVGKARKALQEAVAKGDETTIRGAAENLGKLLGDKAVMRAQKMTSIKATLTSEQLQKLDELKAARKEQAEKFSGQKDIPSCRKRFRGHRHMGDSRGPWRGRHGFGSSGRGPNAEAPTKPCGHGWNRGPYNTTENQNDTGSDG